MRVIHLQTWWMAFSYADLLTNPALQITAGRDWNMAVLLSDGRDLNIAALLSDDRDLVETRLRGSLIAKIMLDISIDHAIFNKLSNI